MYVASQEGWQSGLGQEGGRKVERGLLPKHLRFSRVQLVACSLSPDPLICTAPVCAVLLSVTRMPSSRVVHTCERTVQQSKRFEQMGWPGTDGGGRVVHW